MKTELRSLQTMHALVTGGGRGIGAAIATAITEAGGTVTIVGRDVGALEAQVAAGHAAGWVRADVTDRDGLGRAVDAAVISRGAIDILVSNAGGAVTGPFARTSAGDFRAMWELNFMGTVNAIQAVLPSMTERRFGRIINVASTAALKGYPYVSAYVSAKHAVLGLTRSLALETASTGITVNAVCPGYTDTDLVHQGAALIVEKTGRTLETARAEMARHNPQNRLISPAEVAAAVVFLAGREAGAISGAALPISGGEI